MRIAIVDDNHTDRIFLREGLERILLKRNIENSEIHIFNSAEDILEYLKNEQETFFDLIFMDIYMEKLTGVDAAREIRKKDKKVKIVFIRAPYVENIKEGVEILATVNGNITAVREKNMLAVSFHPELTNDTSVHEYFLDIIKNQKK